MLTVGKLIDHLEMELEQLESECRDSVVSLLNKDFVLELAVEHRSQEYVLEVRETTTEPTSTKSNIKYLGCFNRDLPLVTEAVGINSGMPLEVIAHNSSCGKVDYCLTPIA